MTGLSIGLDERLGTYLQAVGVREDDTLRRLREATAELPNAQMQSAPEQGALMQLLARLMGARRVIEVGTFTGYGALWMARALPADGRLVCCELEQRYIDFARPYWREAEVEGRIEVRLGPALATLDALLAEGGAGAWDMAFIDADKTGYVDYYERCLRLVRDNGLILVDNTLWYGRVADPEVADESTEAIRHFNRSVAEDDRVDVALVPIADGLTFCRKRAE
ncbi:O-methyltransferase [Alkalilimnicola ehrlichii MLHE-1]|uniref:Caffeoyl-CoA O-methyltransferase n=1 Tax=Alkalilimnicola ehrlichii (strain ATCC BAA-1101 / DSM 17681 / MLHE-1) TaxID=187272 RepID=Q0AA18_ALKEH|nr:class I SAM-dependent methyltransferase [Alkalilimnicola ehrlichii]ABI56319.1 Caffeoyl-CoA O-methyltransferase [Alkalilimnicola ehrlichii MLHE-1]